MKLTTRKDLDAQTCEGPGCTHAAHGPLYLHGRCHIRAGLEVSYLDGVLTARCKKCGALVADILVADKIGLA